ncbi:MAG: MoaD/ThiS family protein [Deltaproteobacteria bacterium]|jgi:molybdopterin converting factor small subunit|nr:MoaD/ThiS family protein [Deltaproteobacteria bacterium]MDP2969726.1 MoaD/ThiS family protein [Deltaproteobacteria bacterium]
MAITLKTLRPLSEWIGGSKIEMEWSEGTLGDLISSLIEKRGPELEKELKGEDGSFPYLVSINGRIKRDLSTPIQDGDEIFFFTPLGGG